MVRIFLDPIVRVFSKIVRTISEISQPSVIFRAITILWTILCHIVRTISEMVRTIWHKIVRTISEIVRIVDGIVRNENCPVYFNYHIQILRFLEQIVRTISVIVRNRFSVPQQ